MIDSICVCGAGTMGSGIAQVFASAGLPAILYDLSPDVLEKAKRSIEKDLQRSFEKGKITDKQKNETLERIHFTDTITDCKAPLILEAIVEKYEAKIGLFQKLVGQNPATTIFASNTSSLSIRKIAQALPNPDHFIGIHFFNPATLMKLVEIVITEKTSPGLEDEIRQLCLNLGKIPVVCKDSPGFIVNRVARPFYIESLRLAEETHLPFSEIDALLENAGFKMGPFHLMDLIGNDVNYAVSQSVYDQLGEPQRLKPSSIQQDLVKSGNLGKKTGKGYFDYSQDNRS